MKLQTKYVLFITLIHAVTLLMSFYIFRNDTLFFIISEVVIFISIILAWQLYVQLLQPLKTLVTGIDALRNRDFNIKFLHTGKYEMDQLIDVYNQMVDQLREERTRQEQQHFFLEKLIATSPTGIIVLDHDQKIQQANLKAVTLLNLKEEEMRGHSLSEMQHVIFAQMAGLNSGEAKTISITGVEMFKVQKAHFIDRGFPRYFIMMEELTTEILAAEKKVYEKVIRMMAHEVNNTVGPVNSILNSAKKAKDLWKTGAHDSLKDALQIAINRNENLNVFMRGLADLVKLSEPKRITINLNKLLADVLAFMQYSANERHISLTLQADSNDFLISADEQQLEQALINIIKNAIESIVEKGAITIHIDSVQRRLIISDTGKGIPARYADQVFSPFFSTKKNGQGIGLTLVREILLNHHYSFSLKTVSHRQTEFVIQF